MYLKNWLGVVRLFVLFIGVFGILGCSQLDKKDSEKVVSSPNLTAPSPSLSLSSSLSTLSTTDFESQRQALMQKYSIPDTVSDFTDDDYITRWDSKTGVAAGSLSVQSADEEILPSLEMVVDVVDNVDAVYPQFSEENFVNDLLEENPTMTKEEAKVLLDEKIESIKKEKAYIVLEILSSDENLEEMSVQSGLSIQEYAYTYIPYREVLAFILPRPWIAAAVYTAQKEANAAAEYLQGSTSATYEGYGLSLSLQGSTSGSYEGLYGLSSSGSALDAFRHMYVNILIAQKVEGNYDKNGCMWVANGVMTAHEEGAKRTGNNAEYDTEMDLHNNAVGLQIYNDNAWNKQICKSFIVFKICWDRGNSISKDAFFEKAYQKALSAAYFSKDTPSIIHTNAYSNIPVQYTTLPESVVIEDQDISGSQYYSAESLVFQSATIQSSAIVSIMALDTELGFVDFKSGVDIERGAFLDVEFE